MLGNFLHFAVGALAPLRAVTGALNGPMGWTITLIYVALAVGFGLLLFTDPTRRAAKKADSAL